MRFVSLDVGCPLCKHLQPPQAVCREGWGTSECSAPDLFYLAGSRGDDLCPKSVCFSSLTVKGAEGALHHRRLPPETSAGAGSSLVFGLFWSPAAVSNLGCGINAGSLEECCL